MTIVLRVLTLVVDSIDCLTEWIGRASAWLVVALVLIQFLVVLLRYVFGLGSVMLQESLLYLHAAVFMLAAAYTLRHNAHVRCDIFYAPASRRSKALVDLLGALFFLLPMCIVIGWLAWPFVAASWAVLEGSQQGQLGIPAVFLLKSLILIFAMLLALQGLALAARSLLVLSERD